tara:strand:+ start:986 stop:1969 length:984 start_codon:yes stop_codon:yes gene_type:complete
MEFLAYTVVTFFGVLFSLKKFPIKNPKLFFVIWFSVYFALVIIVRTNFQGDIIQYVKVMDYTSLSIFFIREPVVWLGQRYLFALTESAYIVFVIFDIILGIFLFKALKNFNLPQFAFFSILILFPFVLGMQTAYRQWVANIILLYSFSLMWSEQKTFKTYIFFALSFLSHNVIAVFFPILLVRNQKGLGELAWLISFTISLIGIYIAAETKSVANTGLDLSLIYLLILSFFFCLIFILDKGVIRKIRKQEYKIFLSLLIIVFFAYLLLSSAYIERISMICLIILYPILINLVEERFRQKEIIRIIFTIFGFMPMFLVSPQVSRFIFE